MSNISKKPIIIKEGISVNILDGKVIVSGPKGTLTAMIPENVEISIENGEMRIGKVLSADFEKFAGLARALLANMVEGVSRGFQKQLELSGVGYRARVEGGELVLNVGFSTPVRIKSIEGVNISVNENIITVSGIDKQLVGDMASDIRKVRPPDPYKGKGIKYLGEKLRRKVGKAAKAVGAK
ncbi:MAG: 50S ribosomal protein L6 [Candidatus Levybacteria bacterium RIFCSPHIGHO2_02_FULL_39_36]|nr:MAG: 50S ribosomal protein L6 [Candidatus Levybacteria bacterium GW2011_GWA1_39_11]KKR24985.1 MAG: 50S ribosomal protein L6 [Candidatus Levybacteria bacterium GW2011_GWB1_39_7]KKR27542.1 MAG: 50S ribosomal protein L6 [Microgenomates group bacterium GW2011_GWC1_39_7]KKR48410.1 MAG: 50S ribosomal protein L6 [Candidatus Levybacteria bacterium GW2011_GWA2_40_16]OGH15491.1 MAG: 50S ribosomal protein L6 [Candidatus Levybacteria bacterium RIFCSPHIGHO2_01_FULL_38_96]OGH25601.1 MAG: 50S ribosomal pr